MQIKDKLLNQNSQFKPTIIQLKSLSKNKKKLLKLQLPKNSYLKLNYLISTEKCVDQVKLYKRKKIEDNKNLDNIDIQYKINDNNKPKIIKKTIVNKKDTNLSYNTSFYFNKNFNIKGSKFIIIK